MHRRRQDRTPDYRSGAGRERESGSLGAGSSKEDAGSGCFLNFPMTLPKVRTTTLCCLTGGCPSADAAVGAAGGWF